MKETKNRERDSQCLLINALVALRRPLAGEELPNQHIDKPSAVQAA